MMKIYDRLFETDRHQQSDRDSRDVDEKLSPSMNVLVRWMDFYHGVICLTSIPSNNCAFRYFLGVIRLSWILIRLKLGVTTEILPGAGRLNKLARAKSSLRHC